MEKASFGVVVVAALSVCRSLGLMRVCRTTVQCTVALDIHVAVPHCHWFRICAHIKTKKKKKKKKAQDEDEEK